MNGSRGARLPVGSAPWIAEERSSALQITQTEVEEFSFSARNEFDWLNEHMAEIFTENQMWVNGLTEKKRGRVVMTGGHQSPLKTTLPVHGWLTYVAAGVEMLPRYSRRPVNYEARRLERFGNRIRLKTES